LEPTPLSIPDNAKEEDIMGDLSLRDGIELAVTTEKLGADFYKTLAERFKENAEISELFSILAKDEEAHEAQFMALLQKVPAGEEKPKSDRDYQLLKAAAMSEFFTGEEGPMKDIDKIKTRDDAFARAFALERASLFYYHAMQACLGENEVLQAIVSAEKNHLVSVMKYLVTGAKMRGLADTW
jgi:rubrerythrin